MDLRQRPLHANRRVHAQHALIGAALLLAAAPAHAQVSVEVSPLRVELQAAPGSTTTQGITITNMGAEPVRVRGTVTDWDLSRDGAPQFEGAVTGGPYSATAWIRIAPPEQVIEPGRSGTVRFSLAVPAAGVEPAGYRTGVLFEFAPGSEDVAMRGRQVAFKGRIATLIYVNVGMPPLSAELTNLTSRTHGDQTQVVATLKNTSRRSTRTKGSLVVYDGAGRTVRQVPVPDVPLLPDSEREVAISVVDGAQHAALPAGEYRVELTLDVGLPAVIVGETVLKVPR